MRYLGAHVSTSGGWDKACERAGELGGNCLQLFTGSPRIWKSKSVSEIDFDGFFEARKKYGIERVVIHATYLVNLASDRTDLVEKSVVALKNDMEVCAKGKFDGVVVHVGSHQGRGYEVMRDQMVKVIKEIVGDSPDGAVFLVENSAGQKGKIGSDLEEVKDLIESVGSEKIGWCVDTCHAHAAGYRLSREIPDRLARDTRHAVEDDIPGLMSLPGLSSEEEPKVLVDEIERLKLWKSLKCVHVNDSRDEFGSGRDRHDNLGEGNIDKDDLKLFLSDKRLESIPLILEVPGIDGKGPDRENLDRLRVLVD